MQSPPFPRYLAPPGSKYSPQHHVLKHPQLPFLPQCQRPSFTPIHNNRHVILTAFHINNGYTKAPHCYVLRTLLFLFIKQHCFRLLELLCVINTIRNLTICFATICQHLYHISFFFISENNFRNSNLEISSFVFCN